MEREERKVEPWRTEGKEKELGVEATPKWEEDGPASKLEVAIGAGGISPSVHAITDNAVVNNKRNPGSVNIMKL